MINPAEFVRRFRGRRVLVVGDAILDVYARGSTERLCREAPVPVVSLAERVYNCGGAANTAVNTAALGARVSFLGVIGDDEHGERLLDELRRGGVDTSLVIRTSQRATLAKTRICAGSSILVRVDEGDTAEIPKTLTDAVCARLARGMAAFDAIVFSDYGYGFFSGDMLARLAQLRADIGAPIVVDAHDAARFRDVQPTAIKPNYEESLALLSAPRLAGEARVRQLLDNGPRLLELTGARMVAATLDMDGTILFESNRSPYLVSCLPQPDRQTIGAGDSFVGALALALACDAPARIAVRLAAAAAAVAISKDGTGICSGDDLRAHFHGDEKRLRSIAALRHKVEELRARNQRIVFTNGCFDLLHRGHVEFLKQARALGDVLIVALNNDEGIRRVKGADRPVNSLEDRMEVLASLEAVDYMIAFDGDSPAELLRAIRPDVFAKGGTYSLDSLPEAELVRALGGEVEIVPFRKGVSTTRLIQQIRRTGAASGLRGGQQAL